MEELSGGPLAKPRVRPRSRDVHLCNPPDRFVAFYVDPILGGRPALHFADHLPELDPLTAESVLDYLLTDFDCGDRCGEGEQDERRPARDRSPAFRLLGGVSCLVLYSGLVHGFAVDDRSHRDMLQGLSPLPDLRHFGACLHPNLLSWGVLFHGLQQSAHGSAVYLARDVGRSDPAVLRQYHGHNF